MKCKECGKILIPENMYSKSKCLACNNKYRQKYRDKNREKYNEYHKEYGRLRRWLNGGEDDHLVGEKIVDIKKMSVGGRLIFY